jgi:FkbM family methyltransferase
MINLVKKAIKYAFKIINIDIRKMPEYEKNKFTWLKNYSINTIIDIGANVGQFVTEINKFLPDAKVLSFEPLKDAYNELLKLSNRIKNLKTFNVALGDIDETKKIFKNKFSPSSSIMEMADLHKEAFPFTSEVSKEEIVIKKLDDIVAQEGLKPEILIKLDVQGYEDKVIQGGMETFKEARIIICEVSFYELYKGQLLFNEISDIFKNMGFVYKGSINPGFHPKNGMPLFADAIFIKNSTL